MQLPCLNEVYNTVNSKLYLVVMVMVMVMVMVVVVVVVAVVMCLLVRDVSIFPFLSHFYVSYLFSTSNLLLRLTFPSLVLSPSIPSFSFRTTN